MKFFLKLFINFLVFIFLFLALDICFFYSIFLKEQSVYKSEKEYLKDHNNYKKSFFFPRYFIKLKSFKDIYKKRIPYELRPIQNQDSKENPVLIFGCSYAYGYIFENSETISYVMSKYSKRPIINRAQCGWGVQHMLYQLKEDKKYFSSIKPPKYIFYVLMGYGGHFQRLYHTNFPNVTMNDYYFTYKLKNKSLIERKPFLNLYYGFSIPRHIYNSFVKKYVQWSMENNNPKLYNFIILHFLKINEEIEKLWGGGKKL